MESSQDREMIVRQFATKIERGYHPLKIILFGSYAHGTPGPDSDVDFLVVKETGDRPIDRRIKVRQLLSDPSRRVPIDLLVLTPREVEDRLAKGDQFIEEIVSKGRLLYGS